MTMTRKHPLPRTLPAQTSPHPYLIQWHEILRWRDRIAAVTEVGDDRAVLDYLHV